MPTKGLTPSITNGDTRLRIYRLMVECRQFEVRAQELFFEGLVRGTDPPGLEQEAVAAGFGAAMRPDDSRSPRTAGTGAHPRRGVGLTPVFAELSAAGRAHGGGRSMALTGSVS